MSSGGGGDGGGGWWSSDEWAGWQWGSWWTGGQWRDWRRTHAWAATAASASIASTTGGQTPDPGFGQHTLNPKAKPRLRRDEAAQVPEKRMY